MFEDWIGLDWAGFNVSTNTVYMFEEYVVLHISFASVVITDFNN